MSKLRSVADYEREIAELEAMVLREEALVEQYQDFALQVSAHSLRERLNGLRQEFAALSDEDMRDHELSFTFNGRPVLGHRIEASFLGSVLSTVQALVTAMAAEDEGEGRSSGPFRADIVNASRLHVAETFNGSFGVRLEAIQEQPELDGFFPLYPTIASFLDLLDAGDNEEALLIRIGEIGPRAQNYYRELTRALKTEQADMRVVWPSVRGRREASLRFNQAARVLGTLQDVQEDRGGRWYDGKLDQASQRYGRFGLETVDGEFIDGVVEPHMLDEVAKFYNKECRAYIAIRTVTHRLTGVVKKSYRLQELHPADWSFSGT